MKKVLTTLAAIGLLAGAAACGSSGSNGTTPAADSTAAPATLRLGYFANVTHAIPVVGVAKGLFQAKLGATKLSTQIFNAGGDAIQALDAGSIDAAYLGPSPAITGYVNSQGQALRIVAGAASGGAELVVRKGINSVADLAGKKIATPQAGNTQDVALKYFLDTHALPVDKNGSGKVTVLNVDNSASLTEFQQHQLDGAWLPEPYASRFVVEGGGHVLVDEKSLWPGGKFVTTNLVVSTNFLTSHPTAVKELIEGQLATEQWINANKPAAETLINTQIDKLSGKSLKPAEITRAFTELTITDDPLAATLKTEADHAVRVGLLDSANLNGIYDLRLLNQVLQAAGQPTVAVAGLGQA